MSAILLNEAEDQLRITYVNRHVGIAWPHSGCTKRLRDYFTGAVSSCAFQCRWVKLERQRNSAIEMILLER